MKCIFNQVLKQNILELEFESSAYKVRTWSFTCTVTKIQEKLSGDINVRFR